MSKEKERFVVKRGARGYTIYDTFRNYHYDVGDKSELRKLCDEINHTRELNNRQHEELEYLSKFLCDKYMEDEYVSWKKKNKIKEEIIHKSEEPVMEAEPTKLTKNELDILIYLVEKEILEETKFIKEIRKDIGLLEKLEMMKREMK